MLVRIQERLRQTGGTGESFHLLFKDIDLLFFVFFRCAFCFLAHVFRVRVSAIERIRLNEATIHSYVQKCDSKSHLLSGLVVEDVLYVRGACFYNKIRRL